jgi:DNA-binding PadR family transcriptional regulator
MNVYFALLALLADGPRSGLWLREEVAAGPSGLLPLNARQVYPALARLGRAGLVEPSGAGADDPQQEFRITAGGQRELAGWLRTTPAPAAQPGDELVLKIQLAGQVPGTDVHEVIQAHRRHFLELMQRLTRARPDGAGPDGAGQDGAGQNLGRALASYAELFRLDSVIRWLDAAEGLLAADPADRTASRPPAGHIWASDADRERAVASLRDHFAAGRLTRAELDERLTVALSARTAGDLRRLMADLP